MNQTKKLRKIIVYNVPLEIGLTQKEVA